MITYNGKVSPLRRNEQMLTHETTPIDMSWMTAIKRKRLSAPIRYLIMIGALQDAHTMLDYGCGRGWDADNLGMDKYDPHWFDDETCFTKTYDVITCTYVLNTIPLGDKRDSVVRRILSMLNVGGVAYITVRRDIKNVGFTKRGTYQCNAFVPNAELIRETSAFAIYKITK